MFPQGSYAEGLFAILWCYWEVLEPLEGGAYWKEIRSLRECSWYWYPSSFLLFLHFSPSMRWGALFYHVLLSRIWYLTTGPKATGATNHGPKLWTKINFFSFKKIFLRYFATMTESQHITSLSFLLDKYLQSIPITLTFFLLLSPFWPFQLQNIYPQCSLGTEHF